jgi:hypothetical protein
MARDVDEQTSTRVARLVILRSRLSLVYNTIAPSAITQRGSRTPYLGGTYSLLLPASAVNARSVIVLGQYACQDEADRPFAKSRLHLRLLVHRVQTRSRSRTTWGSTCTIFALPHPPG